MSAVADLEESSESRPAYRAAVTDLAQAQYTRWLRGTAQAFLDAGYLPGDLDGPASDPEVGHFFAEIRAEVSRLLGRPS